MPGVQRARFVEFDKVSQSYLTKKVSGGKLQKGKGLVRSNPDRQTDSSLYGAKKVRNMHMPLTMMDTGVETTIKTIRGKDQTRQFLKNLGFVEGTSVMVVSSMAGNVIVSVKDARVALSQSMASRIMV